MVWGKLVGGRLGGKRRKQEDFALWNECETSLPVPLLGFQTPGWWWAEQLDSSPRGRRCFFSAAL
jgi:hypothetical protein